VSEEMSGGEVVIFKIRRNFVQEPRGVAFGCFVPLSGVVLFTPNTEKTDYSHHNHQVTGHGFAITGFGGAIMAWISASLNRSFEYSHGPIISIFLTPSKLYFGGL
jgi:hypothetical protein